MTSKKGSLVTALSGNADTETTEAPKANKAPRAETNKAEPAAPQPKRDRNQEAMLAYGQQREDLNQYAEAACFYAGGAPIANSVGAEVGIVTHDEKTGEVSRTGVGFYLRSDHLCKLPYYGKVDI